MMMVIKDNRKQTVKKVRLEYMHLFYLWVSFIEEMVMMIMTNNKQIISTK